MYMYVLMSRTRFAVVGSRLDSNFQERPEFCTYVYTWWVLENRMAHWLNWFSSEKNSQILKVVSKQFWEEKLLYIVSCIYIEHCLKRTNIYTLA